MTAKKRAKKVSAVTHVSELMAPGKLVPHPRNYQVHTEDQLVHIVESVREHGFYRNVVVARDYTILAGHGSVQAALKVGLSEIPIVKLDVGPEDPRALKVLTGDNEISRLAERDDRLLTELLREVNDVDLDGLLGTGFDEMMLANLVFVTRPESEIRGIDEAANWVGLPEYEIPVNLPQVIITFVDDAARDAFMRMLGIDKSATCPKGKAWCLRWPPSEKRDWESICFDVKRETL